MVTYDRIAWILSHVSENAKVLDVGCVGEAERYGSQRWLHGLLKKVANEVVGVDIDENGVRELVMQEFNVILADIQNQKTAQIIKEKFGLFDVVVASEVIEHLSNVGLFLDNVKALLKADGLFLLTTPNAQHIRHIIMPYSHSYDHMVSFTMQLLQQILTHHGFTIREKTYLFWIPPKSFIEKVYRNKVIAGLASRLLADTLGVVASPLFLER